MNCSLHTLSRQTLFACFALKLFAFIYNTFVGVGFVLLFSFFLLAFTIIFFPILSICSLTDNHLLFFFWGGGFGKVFGGGGWVGGVTAVVALENPCLFWKHVSFLFRSNTFDIFTIVSHWRKGIQHYFYSKLCFLHFPFVLNGKL